MRIEFSRFVEADFDEIAAFIAQDNPARAVSFIREIRNRIWDIARAPEIYRLRPEIGEDARLALHGRYVILYCIVDQTVRIERVAYGGRDLGSLYELAEEDDGERS